MEDFEVHFVDLYFSSDYARYRKVSVFSEYDYEVYASDGLNTGLGEGLLTLTIL